MTHNELPSAKTNKRIAVVASPNGGAQRTKADKQIADGDEPTVEKTNAARKPKKKRKKRTYCVYVIELEPKVWKLRKKMREANPRYKPLTGKACLYVGMTVYSPEKRFLTHMDGGRNAANVVTTFGRHLRPRLYQSLPRMSQADAEEMERYLAARLRKRGYAVWPVKEGGAFSMNGRET